jgi:single-strand DNA-binding protein
MRSVNKVIIVGNLTRDPELKQTQSNQSICTLGVATNREWRDQGGQHHNVPEFHEVVAWARRAEICHQILKKGNLVYIEGYLKTRSWEGEDGKKRFRTEVVVDDIIKLEKRSATEKDNESYVPDLASDNTQTDTGGEEGAEAASAFNSEEKF